MLLRSPKKDRRGMRAGNAFRCPLRSPRRLIFESLERRRLLAPVPGLAVPGLAVSTSDGEGESDSTLVAIRLEATDLNGSPITTTEAGSDFYLSAWVRDQRSSVGSPGVYAAYLDVEYDDALLTIAPSAGNDLGFDIVFGSAYQNGISGAVGTPGLIDEVGAFQTGFGSLGSSEVLLFRTRFLTDEVTLVDDSYEGIAEDSGELQLDVLANDHIQTGTVHFTGSPADVSPLHDIVLFSPAKAVSGGAVQFVPAELSISGGMAAVIDDVSAPSAGGSVRISADGTSVVYKPASNFDGIETFTYSVAGQEAEVTVRISAINDKPIGSDDLYAAAFEAPLVVNAVRGVLANDFDIEGTPLSAHLVREPVSGTVTLREDGSFDYLPALGFRGRDTFTYVADDAQLSSQEITVRVDVGIPQLSIRLAVTDSTGREVDHATSEDTLFLRAWVEDLRDEYYVKRGVFAAYLDVLYDARILQPVVDEVLPHGFALDIGPMFSTPGSGDINTSGVVNEVGSFAASFDPLGPGEMLLFNMPLDVVQPLVADDQYDVSFQSTVNQFNVLQNDLERVWSTDLIAESADESPGHDVLMFDPPLPVADDQIVSTHAKLELTNSASLRLVSASDTAAGGNARVSADGQSVLYTPPLGFIGTDTFTYTVADGRGRTAEATVVVEVFSSWQNVYNRFDVNADTYVSPIDALLVIHDLNDPGSRVLVDPPDGPPFVDVNGDGTLSAIDALDVIRFLSGDADEDADGEGEGESSGSVLTTFLPSSPSRALSAVRPAVLPATRIDGLGNRQDTPAASVSIRSQPLQAIADSLFESFPIGTEEVDEALEYWESLGDLSHPDLVLEDLLESLANDE